MGVMKKQTTKNFPKNKHFLPPDTHTQVCATEVKNVPFSENLAYFLFLLTLVLRFAPLPYGRRIWISGIRVVSLLETLKHS